MKVIMIYHCRYWLMLLTGTSSRSRPSPSPSVQPKVRNRKHLKIINIFPNHQLPSESPFFFVVPPKVGLSHHLEVSHLDTPDRKKCRSLEGSLALFCQHDPDHHPNWESYYQERYHYDFDHHVDCLHCGHKNNTTKVAESSSSDSFDTHSLRWLYLMGRPKKVQIFNTIGHSWSVLDILVLTYEKVWELEKKYSWIYIWKALHHLFVTNAHQGGVKSIGPLIQVLIENKN